MRIEGIGLAMLVLGCLGLVMRPAFLLYLFFVSTLLGAAAAIILTSLGGANIQPSHLLLAFLAISSALRRDKIAAAIRSLSFPREGFWLALTAVYAVAAAIFLPRIFAGSTYVYAIERGAVGLAIVPTPLGPTSGNITQTIYFLGDLACFLLFYGEACRPSGLRAVVAAALAASAADLVFATLDLGNATSLLSVIRNASYRMLDDAHVGSFRRLVGSFPEASSFAYATLGLFAFCTRLHLANIRPWLTGPLAILLLTALVLATSSSGYGGAAVFLAVLYVVCLWQVLTRPVPKTTIAFLFLTPAIGGVLLLALRLDTSLWKIAAHLYQRTITNKLSSLSGVERELWTRQALAVFFDTHGFGGGTGSVRASSFPVAVLANIGFLGALPYAAFLIRVFCWRPGRWTAPFPAACQSAARWACFAQLIAASLAGSFIDLDLPFFIFAGLAAAGPASRPAAARSAWRQPIAAAVPRQLPSAASDS